MRQNTLLKTRVSYLCAAPRISTHSHAEISGPRAHILGLIQGFETLGLEVKPFIVGDRMPRKLATGKMESSLSGNAFRSIALDGMRWILGKINAQKAWQELGQEVDWVYERFSPFAAFGRTFQRHGIPWVLETHAPLFYEGKTERKTTALTELARTLEIRAYQDCDALVCISEALKEIILTEAGIPAEKVLVVPNAVDIDRFNPDAIIPKRLHKAFTIGFVGRLYAWHGLDLLIASLHELQKIGIDIALTIVGDGLVRDQWEAQAKQLGIADRITFVGQVPWQDVPQYIAGFDVGYIGNIEMQVGKMYHSPLKLYEYMAMAKPVLASAFDDACRVLRESQTGFLFQPGDRGDLKRAIIVAYHQREHLPMMGQIARADVIANHSWSARAKSMTIQLEQILKQKQSNAVK